MTGSDGADEYEPGSPCVSVCVLDEADICLGCYRSADEIAAWIGSTPADKRDIIKRCNERMALHFGWSQPE